jgi:SAM-dependent methyltransferase
VRFHQINIMRDLPAEWVDCTDSLSCLHTIEHLGLGRYGDPLDPEGHLKGLAQLKRLVKPGGRLYLSTPIGPERVEFNAHRIFAASTLAAWFNDGWTIERSAVIRDDLKVLDDLDWNSPAAQQHFGCEAGVGVIAARKG